MAAAAGGVPGAVTVSGGLIDDSSNPANGAAAGIRFNTDGTVDQELENAGSPAYSQISAGTDWIIPNDSATSLYEIRCSNVTANTWGLGSEVIDTWVDLSVAREWTYYRAAPLGTSSLFCDFEIRHNGGAALDLGAYEFKIVETS